MANENLLIDANKAKAVLVNMAENLQKAGNPEMAGAVGYAAEVIGKQPTVDAVEVVHGHWIPIEYDGYADGNPVWDLWECSECQEDHSGDEDTLTPYCPYCGAKMDGERREGE